MFKVGRRKGLQDFIETHKTSKVDRLNEISNNGRGYNLTQRGNTTQIPEHLLFIITNDLKSTLVFLPCY